MDNLWFRWLAEQPRSADSTRCGPGSVGRMIDLDSPEPIAHDCATPLCTLEESLSERVAVVLQELKAAAALEDRGEFDVIDEDSVNEDDAVALVETAEIEVGEILPADESVDEDLQNSEELGDSSASEWSVTTDESVLPLYAHTSPAIEPEEVELPEVLKSQLQPQPTAEQTNPLGTATVPVPMGPTLMSEPLAWGAHPAAKSLQRIEERLMALQDSVKSLVDARHLLLRADGTVGDTSCRTEEIVTVLEQLANPTQLAVATGAVVIEPLAENESESSGNSERGSDEELPPTLDPLPYVPPLMPGSSNLPLPHDPMEVDLQTATREELCAALDDRDRYIQELIRRLRTYSQEYLPPDWLALEAVPEELCRSLESLQRRLEQQLRLAEVENSLERGRLAREVVRLREQSEKQERRARQLGLQLDDLDAAAGTGADKRWIRFLGTPGKPTR